MKTPPFLLGATALFWGWQAGLYPPAIICALVMEASALTKTRLAFELREYKMVWNLSVLILFAALAYLLSTESPPEAFLTLAKWLPLIFLPIAAAQAHGAADRVPLAALSWVFRGSGSSLNLTYPYFVMLMASASAANVRSLGFYAFLGVFSFWALWSIRPRSYSVYTWVISFALVLLTGYAGAVGLNRLQAIVENSLVNLYAKMFLNQPDPFTTNTSIGEVGSLKTSGAIQLRVQTSNGYSTPIYLALAGYNTYKSGSWFAMKSPLVSKTSEPSGLAWKLAEAAGEESNMAVSIYLYGGAGLIPAPVNAHKLDRLPAHKMYVNSLGVIKAGGTPDFFRYLISSSPQAARISAPDENDLKVPLEEEAVISRAAAQIGIIGKEDKAVV
ncbi:MAG: hypothetical protein OEV92_01050, partial [Nitrospinota bacterium]|nr:hypothetical protein [Nitrospinota bacterium]